MNRKLIALDLDGTTLNNNSEVTDSTVQAVQKVIKMGHIVSIVTGRSTRLALPAYRKLNLKTPMINFNGSLGIVPDYAWSGEYEFSVDRHIVLDLLAHKDELGINIIVAEDQNSMLASRPASDELFKVSCGFFPNHVEADQILNKNNLTVNPVDMAIDYDVTKLPQLEAFIADHYGNQVEIAHWGGPLSIFEIKRSGVDKGYGINHLAKCFNIDSRDIIAIGDQVNDLPLLRAAGTKVAMKNAVDSVKSISDVITEYSNEQNGVARYLSSTFN